jgi:predicted outer membrane repeat protein/parallel beta-helix repeat protein
MQREHPVRSLLARLRSNRLLILALLIGAAWLLGSRSTVAYGTYLSEIPNSSKYSCQTCHTGAYANATQIKSDFANGAIGNHMWTLAFADADSDGDGFTNGEELQDPDHTWTSGQANPGTTAYVSNPNSSGSIPPAPQVTNIGGYATPASGNVSFNISLSSPLPVAQVVYTVKDSGNTTVHSFTAMTAPFDSDTWDTTAVPDGNYTVTAQLTESRKKVGVVPRTASTSRTVVVSNAPPPAATTRYVAPTGSDTANDCSASAAPCATIQRAVDQAGDSGDIRVAAAVYTSSNGQGVVYILGSQEITLTGGFSTSNWTTPNPATNLTVIDGEDARPGVYVDFGPSPFTLQGFTIRNGSASQGAGVYVGRTSAAFRNNRFENNNADQGAGGVYVQGSDAIFSDNVFSDNHVTAAPNRFHGGGAVEVASGPNAIFTNNRFENNTVVGGSGGALYLVSGSYDPVLTGNTFLGNQATEDGGALYAQGATFTLTNALFANNRAGRGAAIFSDYIDRATITYATIAATNVTTEALYFENTNFGTKTITLTNTLISGYGTGVKMVGRSSSTDPRLNLVLQKVLMANDGANNVATPFTLVNDVPVTGTPIRAAAGYVGGGDYHLAAGVAAINNGLATPGITTDLDGDTRPTGAAPDIGMDEYVPPPANPPTVGISATDASAAEQGQDSGTFVVTRSGSTTASLTVHYTVGGSASGGDYTALASPVTIPAGSASASILVTPIDDPSVENAETVIVTLSANANYTVGSSAGATVTVADNDNPVQTVSIIANDPNAAEAGSNSAIFTVTRNGSTAAALTINYAVGGTASSSDYAALAGSVAIPAGQAGATIVVTPINDAAKETNETVLITISANAAYVVGTPNNAGATIVDNDGVFVYLPVLRR